MAALDDTGDPAPPPERALAALALVPRARAELDVREAELIEQARAAGAGWAAIASALGLASRQAGEQRLARLRRRHPARQHSVDSAERLAAAARAAAAAVAADPDWDGRWPRAALARQCLAIAAAADSPGGLFSLVRDVLGDLTGLPPGRGLPRPQRDAIDRLVRAAREAGVPEG